MQKIQHLKFNILLRSYIYINLLLFLCFISCEQSLEKPIAYGILSPTIITVTSQSYGKIYFFPVYVNEFIETGRIVALIDTSDLTKEKMKKLAQLEKFTTKMSNFFSNYALLQEQLENAYKDKKRIEFLFADNAATQREIDDINTRIELIKNQIKVLENSNSTIFNEIRYLEHEIKALEDLIAKCILKNPENGIVIKKFIQTDDTVQIDSPLYQLEDVNSMTIKAFVRNEHIKFINKYQKLKIKIKLKENNYLTTNGNVININDKTQKLPDELKNYIKNSDEFYPIEIKIEKSDKYLPNMIAEIYFIYKK